MSVLSVIIPCFNEQENISIIYNKTLSAIKQIPIDDFEIIFIDDGSSDNSLQLIKEISKNNSMVKYISFSRNFGKESAIFAGLEKSIGDFVCILGQYLSKNFFRNQKKTPLYNKGI